MIPAAALRKMLDMGFTLDQAVELAEVWEDGAASSPADPVADRRRAYDRERKRKVRGMSADNSTGIPPDKRKDVSPKPLSEKNPISPPNGGYLSQNPDDPQPEKPTAEPAKPLSAWVSEIWEITPSRGRERSGKRLVENALKAAVRRGDELGAVRSGLIAYYASPDATKDGGQFAQGAHTVISSGRWEAFASDDPEPPDDSDPWRTRLLRWNTAGYWNSEWGPKPGKPGYAGPTLESLAA